MISAPGYASVPAVSFRKQKNLVTGLGHRILGPMFRPFVEFFARNRSVRFDRAAIVNTLIRLMMFSFWLHIKPIACKKTYRGLKILHENKLYIHQNLSIQSMEKKYFILLKHNQYLYSFGFFKSIFSSIKIASIVSTENNELRSVNVNNL